jgi:hypothetical protein
VTGSPPPATCSFDNTPLAGPAVIETEMSKRWFEASEDGRHELSFVNGVPWLIDGGHLVWRGQRPVA